MNNRAVITGLGLLTPLGSSASKTWTALLDGQFIRDHARISSDSPRALTLAIRAAQEAIDHAKWNPRTLHDPATALIVGTSKGPIEEWLNAPPGNILAGESCGFGIAGLATDLAHAIGHGCGPRATLSAACASGIHALIHATLLLRSGVVSRALVVAAEASVHPLFIGSFKRLGVLPAEGVGCRPFDEDRDGFLMSEAAAAVCLETGEPANGIAMIDRFALGGDAFHLTGGDPEGRTLRRLLNAVVQDRPVDLFHAHATGTPFNDPIELSAIESSIDASDILPNVYSHKGAMGHSLGAAGLVSVVLNCMSHRTGIVPPNVQTRKLLPSTKITIAREAVQRRIHRSVAIAAGFGGAVAAVTLIGMRH